MHRCAVVLCAALLAAYAIGLVLWLGQAERVPEVPYMAWSTPQGRQVLADQGVSVTLWSAYVALPGLFLAVACAVAARLVLIGEPSWFGLYLAVVLVLFGTGGGEVPLVVTALYPGAAGFVEFAQGVAWVSLFPLAYVFPTGTFVPRWSRWLVLAWALLLFGPPFEDVLLPALLVTCLAAQIYRYARVSDAMRRAQTRWVLVALLVWLVFAFVQILTPLRGLYFEASPAGLLTYAVINPFTCLALALFPVSVAIAVVRYRLFDIDVWVNRALVYAVLTGFVVAAFTVVVSVVGLLWPPGGNLVGVPLSAALVALTFDPVRAWVQRRVNRLVYGDRDDPYRVLTALGRRLTEMPRPEDVAPAVVSAAAAALKAPYAAIVVGDRTVASTGTRTVPGSGTGPGTDTGTGTVPDPDTVAAIPAETMSVPISHLGAPLGALVVGTRGESDRLSPTDRRLLTDLAWQCGAALSAAEESLRTRRLATDLQQVRQELVTAREEERRRLRRDLHDSLGPALGSQALIIDAARTLVERDPAGADRILVELKEHSRRTLDEVRRLARELRPPVLDELGLAAALEHLRETYQFQRTRLEVLVPELPDLPAATEAAVFRIADEALSNVTRHADANTCTLVVRVEDEALELVVSDDGVGLAPQDPVGVGRRSMRERAEELGGRFELGPRPGGGTLLRARVPIPRTRVPAPRPEAPGPGTRTQSPSPPTEALGTRGQVSSPHPESPGPGPQVHGPGPESPNPRREGG